MRTVHRKTAKGVHEIAIRSRKLGQRPRAALIMINGQVPDDDLLPLLGPDGADILRQLEDQGYIEVVSEPDDPGA